MLLFAQTLTEETILISQGVEWTEKREEEFRKMMNAE